MRNVKDQLPTQSIYTELYRIQSCYELGLLPEYVLFISSCVTLASVIKNYIGK